MAIAQQSNYTLDALIRAKCPLIAITSREEQRVLAALREIACYPRQQRSGRPKPVIDWAVSFGFNLDAVTNDSLRSLLKGPSAPANDKSGKIPVNKADPIEALEAILNVFKTLKNETDERVIFVLKDFNPFFQNVRVTRLLKEIALAHRFHSVILLSASLKLPPEIENSVTLVDYPLPDLEELTGEISALEREMAHTPGVQIDLNNDDQDRQQLARALSGLTMAEAVMVLKQAIIRNNGVLDTRAINVILEEKKQIVNKSGVLEYWDDAVSLDDVGGLTNLKAFLREAELSFTPEARGFGIDPVRGILVGGLPGTGKSLIAKACAGGRHPRPLLRLSISQLLAAGGGIVGQGQARLHEAIKVAEAVSPCVLWADEVEKMFGNQHGELDGGTRRDMLADVLTWMQETRAPIFIVATANDVATLPPEFVRRFDEKFFADLPGPRGRHEVFTVHLRKRGREADTFDLDTLVRATIGFTGAEIEIAVKGGLRKAFLAGEQFSDKHIQAAIRDINPLSRSTAFADKLDSYRQWEARPADGDDPEEETARATGLAMEL